mmetsp:Transcript_1600/g.3416  ORF Transcript_1600/g.3416 Transcript_1600/m.3416 type:complete len:270 (-) Transcript_1600:166-975(-)
MVRLAVLQSNVRNAFIKAHGHFRIGKHLVAVGTIFQTCTAAQSFTGLEVFVTFSRQKNSTIQFTSIATPVRHIKVTGNPRCLAQAIGDITIVKGHGIPSTRSNRRQFFLHLTDTGGFAFANFLTGNGGRGFIGLKILQKGGTILITMNLTIFGFFVTGLFRRGHDHISIFVFHHTVGCFFIISTLFTVTHSGRTAGAFFFLVASHVIVSTLFASSFSLSGSRCLGALGRFLGFHEFGALMLHWRFRLFLGVLDRLRHLNGTIGQEESQY